ncbi:hypothetical protein TRFO_20211 [Tritrichomonas foetus]|uniref:USP domain-containing protein n=1 Tax=Tritrichomonas foetus TaxID=1144522 RepID=A0A1J4KGE0_9EUKA|nr:hypothetical protein TRFO_20211 [Tritrichomonas foetus]|eukprot:OHT10471.1 hypothetical protein TRFO_20211 [Tritrichomonas foetus]
MTNDFYEFCKALNSAAAQHTLTSNLIIQFSQYCLHILEKNSVSTDDLDENLNQTEYFINELIPSLCTHIFSATKLSLSQLDSFTILLQGLNNLALWAMNTGNDKLLECLRPISSIETAFFASGNQKVFYSLFSQFFESTYFETFSEKYTNDEITGNKLLIFAHVYQFCSYLGEEAIGPLFTFMIWFSDYVLNIDEKEINRNSTSTILCIINSLERIFNDETKDMTDNLPSFWSFLSFVAKCENVEKQLAAFRVLNSFCTSQNEEIIEQFIEWKNDNDVISSIIKMDLHIEILKICKDFIALAISDDDLLEFLNKAYKLYPIQREFIFRLVSRIFTERFSSDEIIGLLIDLEDSPMTIEFLCLLTLTLFNSRKEDLSSAFDEVIDGIFYRGESYPDQLMKSMEIFFKELNIVDNMRDNPRITDVRIKMLTKYVEILPEESFIDRYCIFLTDRLDELRTIVMIQTETTNYDYIPPLLNLTLTKALNFFSGDLEHPKVSQAMINLIYILVVFRNLALITGPSDCIYINEPAKYDFFPYALSALMLCQTPKIVDEAINLFSRFFTATSYTFQSIEILYEFCSQYFIKDVDIEARRKLLLLIYRTLRNIEDEFQLEDFEGQKRNHYDDKKGKIPIIYQFNNQRYEIYAKPDTKYQTLLIRIAMRHHYSVHTITAYERNSTIPEYILNNRTAAQLYAEKAIPVVQVNNDARQVSYSSPSFALWKLNFTQTLLEMLNEKADPSFGKIVSKLLSYLPTDDAVMKMPVTEYLEKIRVSKSDLLFEYLLNCVHHFRPSRIHEVGQNLDIIWEKIKSMQTQLIAIFEFYNRVLNDSNTRKFSMFLGGRCFKVFAIGLKKACKIASIFYVDKLTKFINVCDYDLLINVLMKCDDDMWPYLLHIYMSFHNKVELFNKCLKVLQGDKSNKKFVAKLLAQYVKDVSGSCDPTESLTYAVDSLESCNAEQLEDIMNIINCLVAVKSNNFFIENPVVLPKMLQYAFTKGSLNAERFILSFYKSLDSGINISDTSKILREYIINENMFKNIWDYTSMKHIKSALGFTGLRNLSCTCYMNSLFQVLNQIPEFLTNLFSSENDNLINLQWIFASLQTSTRDFIDPSCFINEWKGGWDGQIVDPRKQQDVSEFFQYLMNDCPADAASFFKGTLLNEFYGDGDYHNVIKDDFFVLSVEVKGLSKLSQSLNALIEPELLNNFEANGSKIPVTRQMKILENPKILVIQLHRFEYDIANQRRIKINDRFEFPEHLNIINLLQSEKNCFYTLHSIICHTGNGDGGHYYSLVRKNKKWIKINDREISELPGDYKDEAFGGVQVAENEYSEIGNATLLFYKLDSFNHDKQSEFRISPTLSKRIEKENEEFSIIQSLFSTDAADFFVSLDIKDINAYYLLNVMMHAGEEFTTYVEKMKDKFDVEIASSRASDNFDNFITIFSKAKRPLIDKFMVHAREILRKRNSFNLAQKIVDYIIQLISCRPYRGIRDIIQNLLNIVAAHLHDNPPQENQLGLLNKYIDLFNYIITNNTDRPDVSNILQSIAALLKNITTPVNLDIFHLKYDLIKSNKINKLPFTDMVEEAVIHNLLPIDLFFQFDVSVDRIANIMNETNYIEIGKRRPDIIVDILDKIVNQWDKDRIDLFKDSIQANGLSDKNIQNFFMFFLKNNYYEPTMVIALLQSISGNFDVELFEHVFSVGSMQIKATYDFLIQQLKSQEQLMTNNYCKLISLSRYVLNYLNVVELFEVVFGNVKDINMIKPMFDAFVEGVEYVEPNALIPIKLNRFYLQYEDYIKTTENYQRFLKKIEQ